MDENNQAQPNQLFKIVVPALAVSAVIVLAALIMVGKPNDDKATQSGTVPSASNVSTPTGGSGVPVDTEGMSSESNKPNPDAPEWRPVGDGLKVWDVKEGTGEPCREGATVLIHYIGWTLGGKVFDSSVKRGQPSDFPLGNLIVGWQKGIPGMRPGGIRRLYIPWAMAYGESGSPPNIPGKADLIFEIKLFKIS